MFAFLLKWWPLVVAAFVVLSAGIETRYQVQQLMNDKRVDIEQWKSLRTHGEAIVDIEGRLRSIERHVTPESVQKWGEIQAIVRDDHQKLHEHLVRHN